MNKFDLKAKEIEKRFLKKLKKGAYFFTAKGKENNICGYTEKAIYLKTSVSKSKISISREKIKQAISYLLNRRTATRKDLEQFTNFNSALIVLLKFILEGMTRVQKTVRGLLRLTFIGPHFFFSGLDKPTRADFEAITKHNATFILNTYYWLREKGNQLDAWMKKLEQNHIKVLVDSGAFSLFNAKLKGKKVVKRGAYEEMVPKERKRLNVVRDIEVEEYADFINRYGHMIYGYFNLDVIGDDVKTQLNFAKLKELTGRSPIPVWHCDVFDSQKSNFKLLDEIVKEDHAIVAIGATVELGKRAGVKRQNDVKRELFAEVFKRHPDQNFHWLGGSSNLLLEFPFFSADSSGWLQGRKKIQIYTLDNSDVTTKVMPEWSKEKCLAFNVASLSMLEELYDGIQLNSKLEWMN